MGWHRGGDIPDGLNDPANHDTIVNGVQRGTRVEHCQVRDELGRGLTLVARQHVQARQQIVIGEGGSDGEKVRLHGPVYQRPPSQQVR